MTMTLTTISEGRARFAMQAEKRRVTFVNCSGSMCMLQMGRYKLKAAYPLRLDSLSTLKEYSMEHDKGLLEVLD